MRPTRAGATLLAGLLALTACGGDEEAADAVATTAAGGEAAGTTATTAADETVAPETDAAATTEPATTTAAPTEASTATTGAVATPTTAATPAGPWEDPTGTFRIAFPAEPTAQETQAPLPDGTSIPVTAYLSEVSGAAAVAACVESGSDLTDVQASLEGARDGSLAQFGAEPVSDARADLQGRPGIEFRGVIGEAGALSGRAYLDDVRVCSLLVIGQPDVVDEVAGPFLDSFEFVKEAA